MDTLIAEPADAPNAATTLRLHTVCHPARRR